MIGKLKGVIDSLRGGPRHPRVQASAMWCNARRARCRTCRAVGEAATLVHRDAGARGRDKAVRVPDRCGARLVPTFANRAGRRLQSGARHSLGMLDAGELATAIAMQDKASVARTPGVGPKLAQRIVAELKDKAPAYATSIRSSCASSGALEDGARRSPSRTPSPRWSISATHGASVGRRGGRVSAPARTRRRAR